MLELFRPLRLLFLKELTLDIACSRSLSSAERSLELVRCEKLFDRTLCLEKYELTVVVLAGDSGDLNLVIVGESELFAVVCWLSPIILPFLDNVDESILILRSGEYDLVENESDLKNVLGNVPNVEGEPDMVGLCIFNLPPDVVFEALLPGVDTDPSEDDPISDAEEVLL